MGEFHYINIYASKGVEYLWIIGYLALLVVVAPLLGNLGRNNGKKQGGE